MPAPPCCSGSRATIRTGTGGWRPFPFPAAPELSSRDPSSGERRQLRGELRARRRAIRGAERTRKARQLASRIDALGLLKPGSRIGLYLATSEEIDTTPLLQLARRRGCRIALPRVVDQRRDRMRFFDLPSGMHRAELRRGAFGIIEPQGGSLRAARELDVVFMPLVGFDAQGNRLGMGRGYYDRHFSFRLSFIQCRRPLLVGLAYAVQQVQALPHAIHDVPVDAIVTESSYLPFQRTTP
jgi:5-formyltetrahydrofolate cyclo-ligase